MEEEKEDDAGEDDDVDDDDDSSDAREANGEKESPQGGQAESERPRRNPQQPTQPPGRHGKQIALAQLEIRIKYSH